MFPAIAALTGNDRLVAIQTTGLLETVTGADAAVLGHLALSSAGDLERLASVLIALRNPSPVSVLSSLDDDGDDFDESWHRTLIDPDAIELALSLEIPLHIPGGEPQSYAFALSSPPTRSIARLRVHPFFGEVLIGTFSCAQESRIDLALALATVADRPDFDRVFDAIDAYAKTMPERWTLGALDAHQKWLEAVIQPAVFARCPSLMPAIRSLTMERLLRNQLRAGVMNEWAAPEQVAHPPTEIDPALRWPGAVLLENSKLYRVERRGGPLGVRDGFGGHAMIRDGGSVTIESVDGRRRFGLLNRIKIVALMTFPEREGVYPVLVTHALGIAEPDGTPLVPVGRMRDGYWRDQLKLPHWFALRPADLPGSRALVRATDEMAARLLDGVAIPEGDEPYSTPTDAAMEVVATVMPQITAPSLRRGVAILTTRAHVLAPALSRLKARILDEPIASSTAQNTLSMSLYDLFDRQYHPGPENEGTRLGQQMFDVSHYLLRSQSKAVFIPAATIFPWPLLFSRMGEVVYRLFAPATSKHRRAELLKIVRLWLQTDFPRRLRDLRLVHARLETTSSPMLAIHRPVQILSAGDRCFATPQVTWSFPEHGSRLITLDAWEASATVISEAPIDVRFDVPTLEAALAMFEARGPMAFDRQISEAIAEKTGLSVAAASLVWTGGYDPWLIGMKKRWEYGITRPELDAAEDELMPLRLREIYVQAMHADPAKLYDRAFIIDRFTTSWPPAKTSGAPRLH